MRAGLLIGLLLALPAALVAEPRPVSTGVMHEPPGISRMGSTVAISVVLEIPAHTDPVVLLYYRPKGSRDYSQQLMEGQGGRYEGAIPARATLVPSVRYYITVEDPEGTYSTHIGSPERPLRILLLRPGGGVQWKLPALVMLGLACVLLASFSVWLGFRNRRRRLKDRVFWLTTLAALLEDGALNVEEQLELLTLRRHDHPVDGPRMYSRGEISRKLDEVRSLDIERLAKACRRYLGSGWDPPRLDVCTARGQAGEAVNGDQEAAEWIEAVEAEVGRTVEEVRDSSLEQWR